MTEFLIENLDWEKMDDLIPAVIQDVHSGQVLMLGYMNREAVNLSLTNKEVTFYSRSKKRLWTKGETSGHALTLVEIVPDCDQDALLVLVKPKGPCCHLGTTSCFVGAQPLMSFLPELEKVVEERVTASPEKSYTAKLFSKGLPRIAQKVGEEGVEVALAAVTGVDQACVSESADLFFHLLVLLRARGLPFKKVIEEMKSRVKHDYDGQV